MITFELMPSVDEQVFDRLFDESKDIMDGGSFPWELFRVTTDEEKRGFMLRSFNNVMTDPGGIGWQVVVDGEIRLICAGTRKDDLIKWELGLCGTRNGSRSWLYDADYEPARNIFWENVGVRGWIMSFAGEGRAIHNHITTKKESGSLQAKVETQASKISGFIDITVTKE